MDLELAVAVFWGVEPQNDISDSNAAVSPEAIASARAEAEAIASRERLHLYKSMLT